MKGARINFGVPNSEYVLLADDDGAAVSLKNQDTDTEYIGGGGGDFSTAILTLVADDDLADIQIPIFVDSPVISGSTARGLFVEENPIILYKGACIIGPFGVGMENAISISGDGEWVTPDEMSFLKVTGDCTITYTPNT